MSTRLNAVVNSIPCQNQVLLWHMLDMPKLLTLRVCFICLYNESIVKELNEGINTNIIM